MVNYFIYARDFSGSTTYVKPYHRDGLKTLEQFKNDVKKIEKELLVAGEPSTESKIVYLHWDEYCWDVNEDKTRKAYMDLDGDFDATKPESIIKYLKEHCSADENDKIKLLYIVTDGMIDEDSALECYKLNKDMYYETVVFHVLNENLKKIDLTAATSFFKKRCLMYCNNKLFDNADISKEFDYNKVNIYNFLAERNQLKSYIKLKFINKSHLDQDASEEIKKLNNLRDRLFEELPLEKVSRGYKDVHLKKKDRNLLLREFLNRNWYENFFATVSADKLDIEKSMSALINYIVSNVGSYSFDTLKFDTKFNVSIRKDRNAIRLNVLKQKLKFSSDSKISKFISTDER